MSYVICIRNGKQTVFYSLIVFITENRGKKKRIINTNTYRRVVGEQFKTRIIKAAFKYKPKNHLKLNQKIRLKTTMTTTTTLTRSKRNESEE